MPRPNEFISHGLYVRQHEDGRYYVHNHDSWPSGDSPVTPGYGTPDQARAAAIALAAEMDKHKARPVDTKRRLMGQ